MRRPLDWIVVSISLMVLFANRMLTDSDPVPVASVPDLQVLADDLGEGESFFGYIREDGSQVFLPAAGQRGPARPASASTTNAIYTWSQPMVTPLREAALTSAWTSSR
jgi:hypothetical protein